MKVRWIIRNKESGATYTVHCLNYYMIMDLVRDLNYGYIAPKWEAVEDGGSRIRKGKAQKRR